MIANVVLIHDDESLRRLLADLLRAWRRRRLRVEEADYGIRMPSLWQRWMREADLFVIGLDRQYELGLRAEGVAVAEQLARAGKRVLVVGSECSGGRIALTSYWDIGSSGTLLEAVARSLNGPPPSSDELATLRRHFKSRLQTPTGHSA